MGLLRRFLSAFLLLMFFAPTVFAVDGFIWIEGESAVKTNMKPHPWYAGTVKKAELSGDNFISTFGGDEGRADYVFSAMQAGSYSFWIRANPAGEPKLDYQLNGGPWVPVNFGSEPDLINLGSDGNTDLRFIAWIKVGAVALNAGRNTISFKFHSTPHNHGSLDCFVFSQAPFVPNGKLKPGQKLGTDEPGWWSFEPVPDNFGKDALLDLRALNENEAGQSGFIQAGGDSFKLGNGQPVRFWAVNTTVPSADLSKAKMDVMAARFAKLGINMVRIYGPLFDRVGDDPGKIDLASLDKYFYLINALKKQGIYVHLSNYFPLWLTVKASDGIPGTEDIVGQIPFGLLIFEPRMQELYKSWIRQILTTKSPYSGKTLAEETSVGVFEIQNEDSLFFWTFKPESLGKGPRELLEKKFASWLVRKYGSLAKAFAAWPNDKHPDDNVAASRAGLYGATEMSRFGFAKESPSRLKGALRQGWTMMKDLVRPSPDGRLRDQIHFLAEIQNDFYVNMKRFLREELGTKFPLSASNWIAVPGLGFIERYTYSSVEVIDKHGYFGGKHEGKDASWSVHNGHTYEDRTAMFDPEAVPFQYVRLPGHPHVESEIAWPKPNRYVGEAELLLSTYASLQGVDGIYLFQALSGDWETSGTSKWPYMMPGEIGQSPANAIQYRRGDLRPGNTVIRQVTTVDDLLALKSASLLEGYNTDFRITEAPKADQANQTASFDPLSFFVGRVERTFDSKAEPIAVDLSKYIDRDKKIVTSSTGEIIWDYGRGLLTVNAPRTQAVTGFLSKAGAIKLGDVTIDSRNEYATVHVISLDGQPLANSRKILIQAFTEEKMNGFKAANGIIQDIGQTPVIVRDIDTKVTIRNGAAIKAIRLDERGYANGNLQPQIIDGTATIILPKDALYTILLR